MFKEGIDGKISKVLKSLNSDIKLYVKYIDNISVFVVVYNKERSHPNFIFFVYK